MNAIGTANGEPSGAGEPSGDLRDDACAASGSEADSTHGETGDASSREFSRDSDDGDDGDDRDDDDDREDESGGDSDDDDDDGEAEGRIWPEFSADPSATTIREWLEGKPLDRLTHLILGLVLPLIVGFTTMWRLRAFTIDDAYISYRYARNLADGLGLVYNAGERIEGYTNFSWTALLALGAKLGVDPAVSAKWLGLGCGLSSVLLAFLLEARVRPLRSIPALSPWLLATTTASMGYAVFGLETAMFVTLVLGGILLVMRERATGGFPWSGIVFGIAGVTRPEAPMFLGLTMLFLPGPSLVRMTRAAQRPFMLLGGLTALCLAVLVKARFATMAPLHQASFWTLALIGSAGTVLGLPRGLFSKQNLLRGSLFLALIAMHLVWRKSYYGAWVPNTFVAKTGDVRLQIAGGIEYLKRYSIHEGFVLPFVFLGLGAAIGRKNRWLLGFATMSVCITTYVALVGGDWMPMHRFATPLQPFLYLLVACGLRELFEQRSAALNWGLALLLVGLVGYRANRLDEDRRKILSDEKAFWDRAAGGVSRWYAELERLHGKEAVAGDIALGDIGQVGYETRLPVVDLLGLVDPVVAGLPGGYTHKTGPGFRNYFFERRPRYFVLISAQNDCVHPSVTGSIALYRDRRFRSTYAVSGRVLLNGGFSWCVYERNESIDTNRSVVVVDEGRTFEVPRSKFGLVAMPANSSPSSPTTNPSPSPN